MRGAAGRVLELRHVRLREEGRGGARRGRGAAHKQQLRRVRALGLGGAQSSQVIKMWYLHNIYWNEIRYALFVVSWTLVAGSCWGPAWRSWRSWRPPPTTTGATIPQTTHTNCIFIPCLMLPWIFNLTWVLCTTTLLFPILQNCRKNEFLYRW